jgi:hypothetical protein
MSDAGINERIVISERPLTCSCTSGSYRRFQQQGKSGFAWKRPARRSGKSCSTPSFGGASPTDQVVRRSSGVRTFTHLHRPGWVIDPSSAKVVAESKQVDQQMPSPIGVPQLFRPQYLDQTIVRVPSVTTFCDPRQHKMGKCSIVRTHCLQLETGLAAGAGRSRFRVRQRDWHHAPLQGVADCHEATKHSRSRRAALMRDVAARSGR